MHKIVLEEFEKYYSSLNSKLLNVQHLNQREMAFLQFSEQIMIRHMVFPDAEEIKFYLCKKVPAHVYYSSAYYSRPSDQNMNKKGWLGADLIFDIDADHIPTACKNEHDTWNCLDCGSTGKGFPPENCPKCGKKRLETKTWVCNICLNVAKNEIFKLVNNFMVPDFGISEKELEIYFSGHRGYHLHIISDKVNTLTNDGRREIADYVRGIGIDPELLGFRYIGKKGPLLGPSFSDKGWRGRLAKAIYEYLCRCDLKTLQRLIGTEKQPIVNEADMVRALNEIMKKPSWWGRLSPFDIKKIKTAALESIKELSCNIDERVTIDTKRLIRYPNTLHGKSGFITRKINLDQLESFDPLMDAIAFKGGTIKVYVKDIPRIRLGEEEIGPIKNAEEVEVPKAIGIYLLCRGAAEPR